MKTLFKQFKPTTHFSDDAVRQAEPVAVLDIVPTRQSQLENAAILFHYQPLTHYVARYQIYVENDSDYTLWVDLGLENQLCLGTLTLTADTAAKLQQYGDNLAAHYARDTHKLRLMVALFTGPLISAYRNHFLANLATNDQQLFSPSEGLFKVPTVSEPVAQRTIPVDHQYDALLNAGHTTAECFKILRDQADFHLSSQLNMPNGDPAAGPLPAFENLKLALFDAPVNATYQDTAVTLASDANALTVQITRPDLFQMSALQFCYKPHTNINFLSRVNAQHAPYQFGRIQYNVLAHLDDQWHCYYLPDWHFTLNTTDALEQIFINDYLFFFHY